MKYLLLIALALALVWWWRLLGRKKNTGEPTSAPAQKKPVDVIACRHCGLHLPRAEALGGTQGSYCSEAHRRASEESANSP